MKEKLYTLEVMDALDAADECPCCYLERKIEQDAISFALGSSYMESDIREETDRTGFCRHHTKMMYDHGNSLGNAWILKTRLEYVRRQFHAQAVTAIGEAKEARGLGSRVSKILKGAGVGSPLHRRRSREQAGAATFEEDCGQAGAIASRGDRGQAGAAASGGDRGQAGAAAPRGDRGLAGAAVSRGAGPQGYGGTCYVCSRFEEAYGHILETFLYLMRTEPEFLDRLKGSKGFCLPHFADIMRAYTEQASDKERQRVVPALYQMMEENLQRIQGDIDWFIDKFDHRNRDADWKTSKDAVPRTMQKLVGSYPADPVFRQK